MIEPPRGKSHFPTSDRVVSSPARPEGLSSNFLFEILEEWNRVLQETTLAACLALNK